jgi:hypothetical protein
MTEAFDSAIEQALLVAWDGCHKIYVAMDDTEADWFLDNYEYVHSGSPSVMSIVVRDWYERSCGLRFISSVRHDDVDPNGGFTDLVPQFAEEEMYS